MAGTLPGRRLRRSPLAGVRRPRQARPLAIVLLAFVTILAGGFVAGSHAGLIYNEFPRMGGGLVPPDYRNPALSWLASS